MPFNNKRKITSAGIKIKYNNALLVKCKIICKGVGNVIEFGVNSTFRNCSFYICGNNNVIRIGSNCFAKNAQFHIEDCNNSIVVGDKTAFCGKIHLAAIEGTKIEIGNNCLLSSEIVFRTGDSHSLLNMDGERINPSQDIVIGNKVWIGHKVMINKGVAIADDSMIGSGAIVTKKFTQQNVVIAGVPAKIIKENITWTSERI